jgi:hypothetical protein
MDLLPVGPLRVPISAAPSGGTVTDLARTEAALAAGGSFIVTANINFEVIRAVRAHGIPVMPGALTPTEIWIAANAGRIGERSRSLGGSRARIRRCKIRFDRRRDASCF